MCSKCLKMRLLFGAIGFVAGGGVGALTVYLLNKKKINEQTKLIDELLDEINEPVEVNPTEYDEDTQNPDVVKYSTPESYIGDRDKLVMKQILDDQGYSKIPGGEKPDLSSLSAQDPVDDESFDKEDESESEDDMSDESEVKVAGEPEYSHEISVEEFLIDSDTDKDTVEYFLTVDEFGHITDEMSDVFYDKDDDALPIENYVDNPEDIYTAVKKAFRSHDQVMYWRCPKLNLDLEIVINLETEEYDDSESYERGGYEKTPRTKPKKSDRE